MNQTVTASWAELLSGRNGLRSIAVSGGVALHAINVYVVTTILPSVVKDIGGLEYYAWNTTLFVVASILSSTLSPKALDAFGPRRAFLLAILGFALGTVVCASAPSMLWMLVGRTVQGLGGGLLLGLSYSSIRIVFEERLWSRAMALVSSMWGVATLSGPAIGGIFADEGHWRWAFWVVVPIAAILALLVQTQIATKSATSSAERVKVPLGKISLIVVSVLIISVGSLSGQLIWNIVGIVLGLLVAAVVVQADKRATIRLLPEGSYSLKNELGILYACIALLSVAVTIEVFVPYFLQIIHGHTPLIAGYMAAVMAAGWTIGSIISSGRSPAVVNFLMRAGPVMSTAALVSLAVLMPMTTLTQANGAGWWLVLPLLAVGIGIGFCWPHLLTKVFKSAPAGQENIASSAVITIQLYALALGATLAGIVTNLAGFTQPGGLEGARQAALALFVVFTLAPAVAALLVGRVSRSNFSRLGRLGG